MRELLSDSALACPAWQSFELDGVIIGLLLGFILGFLISHWKTGNLP